MRKLQLPYVVQDIVLATPDKVEDQYWDKVVLDLEDLLDFMTIGLISDKNDLQQFNNYSPGVPFSPSTPFWNYLLTNIQYNKLSEGLFNPFSAEGDIEELVDLGSDRSIVKLQELRLKDTLLDYFFIDQLDQLLAERKIPNYALSTHNTYIARGGDKWEFNFEHPIKEEKIELVAADEAVIMDVIRVQRKQEMVQGNPFQNYTHTPKHKAVIVESASTVKAKVVAELCHRQLYEMDFQNLATNWNSGITVVYEDEVKQFAG